MDQQDKKFVLQKDKIDTLLKQDISQPFRGIHDRGALLTQPVALNSSREGAQEQRRRELENRSAETGQPLRCWQE